MSLNNIPILKKPYFKGKNFCANPVVKYGIPGYADSVQNPKVIGTPDYLKYWEEQLYYIQNGIQTGGIFIPGRYYYFMNFSTFSTVGGVVTPDMCDLHLELAYLIDYAKANGKNIMAAKGRRKGISEFTQKAVIDYGYRFNFAYQAGVAAGLKDYAEDFMKKWSLADSLMVPEFRMGTLLNNDDEVIAGYKIKEKGQYIDKGTNSKILVRTMHTNPNMFKGLYLNDVIAEECGEFEKLKEFYSATRACLTKGTKQVGTMFFYGTGGNINKGSKDFKEMWENAEQYNFIKFLIPATRFYFPHYGGATENGQDVGEVPKLLSLGDKKPYQLIGVEDEVAARESILADRAIKKKGPLKDYLEELQNFPLDETEIFKKMFSNNFDIEKINNQQDAINAVDRKYSKYRLEWITNDKGERAEPLRVKAVPAKSTDDENDCVLIMDAYHPDPRYKDLYVAGCLTPGEKVLTNMGLVNVEDIDFDHKLVNKDGKYVDIINTQKYYKENEDTYELKLSNTYRSTNFTKEHPIYVSDSILNSDKTVSENKLDFEYKKVSDININNWVKYPNIYNKENEIDEDSIWNKHKSAKKYNDVKSPLKEKDFWWFIGVWLGDGWCDDKKGKITVAFNSNEIYYIDKYKKVISSLFNRSVTFRDKGKGSTDLSFSCKKLTTFLLENFGKYAYGKKIPEWSKFINKELKYSLIHGYLSSDGNICQEGKRKYFNSGFTSINLELLESMQDICFSVGLISGITKSRNETKYSILGRKESVIKECYQLRLGHHDTVKLCVLINDDNDIKLKKIDLTNLPKIRKRPKDGCFISEDFNFIYFKIRSIKKSVYTGWVYNFECETHTFMCHHINTHNCDAYDQDKGVSKSLGAMCVLMRRNTIHPEFQLGPVAVICTRPKRKEMFFDMCCKLSVYYNLVGNTLGDKASSSGIINWYKDNGCQKYLAVRPTKFESTNSEQSHEYWVSLNAYSRPLMVGMMQTAIYDYVQNIWFPQLIDQLGNFDEVTVGSDNDLADAYGIALMQDVSVGISPRDLNYSSKDDPFLLNTFEDDDEKEKRVSVEQDWKGFGR